MDNKQITQDQALVIIYNNLRWYLDCHSVARSVLVLDPIPKESKPIYDHDGTNHMAFFATQDTTPPDKYKPGDKLPVPIFSYKYTSIVDGYFSEYTATKHYQNIKNQIANKESKNLVDLLDRACLYSNHIIKIEKYNLIEMIKLAKTKLEPCDKEHDIIVTHILVNKNDFIKTLENLKENDKNHDIDPPTHRYAIESLGGYCFGATLHYEDCVPEGTIYATADPEFVGVLSLMTGSEKFTFLDEHTFEASFDAGYAIFCPTHVCKVSM